MSAYQPPYQYVIDSSALFDLKDQYPVNIFSGLWDSFNDICRERLVIAPREVLREIKGGNDELLSWAHEHEDIFLEPCEEELIILQALMGQYPKEVIAKYSTRPWADPLVIACAKHYRLPIIQHETNDRNQYKIPPMAAKLKIKCIKLVEFFNDQNWNFRR
jgi:hypothetical protein